MNEFNKLLCIGDKLIDSYEDLCNKENNMISNINEKVIFSDYSDLNLFESDEYFKEAKESIIEKFFAWITRVIDAILGRNKIEKKLPSDAKVTIDSNIEKRISVNKSLGMKIKKLFTKKNLLIAGGTLVAGKVALNKINDKIAEDRQMKIKKENKKKAEESMNQTLNLIKKFSDEMDLSMEKLEKNNKGEKLLSPKEIEYMLAEVETHCSALKGIEQTYSLNVINEDYTTEELSLLKEVLMKYFKNSEKLMRDLTVAYNKALKEYDNSSDKK